MRQRKPKKDPAAGRGAIYDGDGETPLALRNMVALMALASVGCQLTKSLN